MEDNITVMMKKELEVRMRMPSSLNAPPDAPPMPRMLMPSSFYAPHEVPPRRSMNPNLLRMIMSSSLNAPKLVTTSDSREEPDYFEKDSETGFHVCLDCYKRMSDKARSLLGDVTPQSLYSEKRRPGEVTCEYCHRTSNEFSASGKPPAENSLLGGHK